MSPSTFTCQACLSSHPASSKILVANQPLCRSCITLGLIPAFQEAVKTELSHPVIYNNTILSISDFSDFFSEDFLTLYEAKMQEYKVPIPDRLYCDNTHPHCNRFLGSKSEIPSSGGTSVPCPSCSNPETPISVCILCSHCFSSTHTCAPRTDESAFAGLIRGIDYQLCRNKRCGAKVQLSEACNEMKCAFCGTGFCYICGGEPERGHYKVGMECPRFGRKGQGEAVFDRGPDMGGMLVIPGSP